MVQWTGRRSCLVLSLRLMRAGIVLLFLASCASDLRAQTAFKQVEHQKLHWYGYFGTLRFNERWSLISDIQERRFLDPDAQHQLVMRTQLQRELVDGWAVAIGMCRFLQSPNDPQSASDLVVPELRPHAEISSKQRAGRWCIGHRFRTEARFFHGTQGEALSGGYTFSNIRVRYRLSCDVPLVKAKEKDLERLTLRVADELHVNFGSNIVHNAFDQNRIMVGLQTAVSKSVAIELGYLSWYQQRPSGVQYYARDIVRIAVHHHLHFGPEREPPAH